MLISLCPRRIRRRRQLGYNVRPVLATSLAYPLLGCSRALQPAPAIDYEVVHIYQESSAVPRAQCPPPVGNGRCYRHICSFPFSFQPDDCL